MSKDEDNLVQKMNSLEISNSGTPPTKRKYRISDGENQYLIEKVIGKGSFGVVYRVLWEKTSQIIAIKKVLQDKRYKNREYQIMKSLHHCNIVELKHGFFIEEGDKVFLHLVLEYVPYTIHKICRNHYKKKLHIPILSCKLYIYQICRSLAYLHSKGICHRDIKPQNLLIDPNLEILKLCDFGSAKILVKNQPNIAYICSRYYRAPELIFGSTNYTTAIDIWSTGCVFGELLIGRPLFQGETAAGQLVEIMKILGTPTADQIQSLNQNHMEFCFPFVPTQNWTHILPYYCPPEAIDLISKILVYKPEDRLKAIEICAHPFFDELRDNPDAKLPNGNPLPPLFNFSAEEMSYIPPSLLQKLIPKNYNPINSSNINSNINSNNNNN